MARTEVWVEDDIAPTGRWVWIGGYEGHGVTLPVIATAAGLSTTVGEAIAAIAGKVIAIAEGTSSTVGDAVASTSTLDQYLALTGLSNSYASIPDEAALDFAGSHTVRVRMRMPDWTPAINAPIVMKWPWSGGQWSWGWRISADGRGYFQWSTTGSTSAAVSTVDPLSPTPTADTLIWLQFALDSTTRLITVSTHPDQVVEPTTGWTQVAQSVGGATTGTIYSGTAAVSFGGFVGGGATGMVGDIFQLTIRDASDALVFTLDPDNWTSGTTWVSNTGQTVTLAAGATIETP